MESKLAGYHVYRRCAFEYCEYNAMRSMSHFACENTWQRLTVDPISTEVFLDTSVGGLAGAYNYLIRPVGPDAFEGRVQKILNVCVPPLSGIIDGVSCWRDDRDVDPQHGYPWGPRRTHDQEVTRINGVSRGSASPSGPPATPTVLPVGGEWRTKDAWWSGQSTTRFTIVKWLENQESDLAGYRVEYAGSPDGPWAPLSSHLVAWWETQYVAQGFGHQRGSPYDPPTPLNAAIERCTHFRVIAVDEEGQESEPGYPSDQPRTGCPETPSAPRNLRASNGTPDASGCTVRLDWDPPGLDEVAPAQYVVHRFLFEEAEFDLHFYETKVLTANVNGAWVTTHTENSNDDWSFWNDRDRDCPHDTGPGDDADCDTGFLEAYYVTARGANGADSPRSNLVFWSCAATPGYAKLRPWSPDAEAREPLLACFERPERFGIGAQRFAFLGSGEVSVRGDGGGAAPATDPLPRPDRVSTPAPLLLLGQTANPPWKLYDLHTDHLGSVRVESNGTAAVVARHDYFPFGETMLTGAGFNSHEFTGHERDKATGLDYMLARYYGGNLPRFLSVDPIGGFAGDPQSWNRYTYSRNNPLAYRDPDGEFWDYVLDAAGLAYDVYELWNNPSWGNAGTLLADVGLGLVPFVPNTGAVRLAAKLGGPIGDIAKGLANRFVKNLDPATVEAAARQSIGETDPWKHLQKYDEARRGVTNDLEKLKKLANDPSVSPEERAAAQNLLSEGSKRLDEIEKYFEQVAKEAKKKKGTGSGNGPNEYGIDPDGPYGPQPHPCQGKVLCGGS